MYINEFSGVDDISISGSEKEPFKTAAYGLFSVKNGDEPKLMVFKKNEDSEGYVEITASALKKARKGRELLQKKSAKQAEQVRSDNAREAAKKLEMMNIRVEEDKNLPVAERMRIENVYSAIEKRVKVSGWVHRLRSSKAVIFTVLRDGTGYLQTVVSGNLTKTYQMSILTLESTVTFYGTVKRVPEGKSAPGGVELDVDYYEIVGLAPSGDEAFSNKVQECADASLLLDQRHLMLRGEGLSSVMKVRARFLKFIRRVFEEERLVEVTPPCIVSMQVEGGSTLFKLDYYGENAYLTQSSQLYLETCLASLGNVYCIQESFRAEKSHTRRHLSEYTHIEGELCFIEFEDLLQHLERLITNTIKYLLEDPIACSIINQLNPGFQPPQLPFKRMEYKEAIMWLNEHGIKNEEGEDFKFGDDIPEAAERNMTDTIGVPIFLIRFPLTLKSFYMKRCSDDPTVTESVDVLMPNVGEITGGSMRVDSVDELLAGFKREGIDPSVYNWFIDQRRYGTCPHGGYGIGIERILAWLCNRYTVRDCSLYPRFTGRCKP